MRTNNKKGVSLIVLIITIIVMIILAAAIILSMSNSKIMDKADKAKEDSDTANLKEYVNVLTAEWEMMTKEEQNKAGKSRIDYINTKLEKKGYTRRLNEEGILLAENTVKALKDGIKIGDEVIGYKLDSSKTSYITSGKENTAKLKSDSTDVYEEVDITTIDTKQTISRIEYSKWRYIGVGENGEILIAPDMVSANETQKIKLSGKGGFVNGPTELNNICKEMYSTSKGTARSMNIEDINRILDYTGDKGIYVTSSDAPKTTKEPIKISELGVLAHPEKSS